VLGSSLIIDSTHKTWIATTAVLAVLAVALYLGLDHWTPGGLTGGSTIGLWYGIAGSLLMVFAGLLSGLRKVPAWWWIGSRKAWLRGHVWLGLLSGVLVLCHSGFHWGGPLEIVLWIVLAATLLTGLLGLYLQHILPRMITTRVAREAPYEQIPHLCQMLRKKAHETISSIWGVSVQESQASVMATQVGIGAKIQLQEFFEKQVRPVLADRYVRSLPLANRMRAEAAFSYLRALPGLAEVRDQVNQLESLCEERRQLAEQERLHAWLHGWLLVHIPLSVALLAIGVAHVVASLYY
jgi:hypothetical protein